MAGDGYAWLQQRPMITSRCEPGAPGAPMRQARSVRCVSPSIRWAQPFWWWWQQSRPPSAAKVCL